MKKYRLKIPKMIRREDARIANDFSECETVFYEETEDRWTGDDGTFAFDNDIPKDWLEEIKEPEILDEHELNVAAVATS